MGRSEPGTNLFEYGRGDSIDICQHIAVPEADHAPAKRFQKIRTNLIAPRIDMLAAVQLYRQLHLPAGEINDVVANRQLAGKPRPIRPQHLP